MSEVAWLRQLPVFWSIPTMVQAESAAAACFGLITSIGQLGGFVGPYAVGYLNQMSGSLLPAFALIGGSDLRSAFILSTIRIRTPASGPAVGRTG
jgi:MFS transporter, ACS family, tartrate transporter